MMTREEKAKAMLDAVTTAKALGATGEAFPIVVQALVKRTAAVHRLAEAAAGAGFFSPEWEAASVEIARQEAVIYSYVEP